MDITVSITIAIPTYYCIDYIATYAPFTDQESASSESPSPEVQKSRMLRLTPDSRNQNPEVKLGNFTSQDGIQNALHRPHPPEAYQECKRPQEMTEARMQTETWKARLSLSLSVSLSLSLSISLSLYLSISLSLSLSIHIYIYIWIDI